MSPDDHVTGDQVGTPEYTTLVRIDAMQLRLDDLLGVS